MKRCAIYARVSSSGQVENTSIDTQLELCRTEATAKGYTVIAELREEGVSGAKYDRPSMSELLLLASTHRIDVVLLAKVDRLARGRLVDSALEAELLRSGVQVHYVGRDTSTKEGRLLVNIEKDFAEWEREAIAERTHKGKDATIRQGKIIPTRHTAIGYTYDREARTLVVDEERAQVVRLIFTLFADEGLSLFKVAQRLNALHIPTRSNSRYWVPAHIRDVITSELYKGEWVWNRYRHIRGDKSRGTKHRRVERPKEEWLRIDVPAIIPADQWQAAQSRLRTNAYYSDRRKKYEYLLAGLIFCSVCGRRMAGRNLHPRYYYACPRTTENTLHPEGRACTTRMVRVDVADSAVWDEVCRQFGASEQIIARLRKRQEVERVVRPDLDTAFMEGSLSKERERHALLLDLYLDGKLDKPLYLKKRTELEAAIEGLEQEIARRVALQNARSDAVGHAGGLVGRMSIQVRAGLLTLPYERRTAFLRDAGVRVVAREDANALSVYGLLEEVELALPRRRVKRSA